MTIILAFVFLPQPKRTTVSLAVIMFELTDTLTYVVPIMLSVLVAKTVADVLEPKGIYDLVIELNQLPYLDTKHEYLWGNLQINDVVCLAEYKESRH